MRVLQLLPELNEGGIERGVVELNREFTKQGIESLVISKGGKLVPQIISDGGQHFTLNICDKNLLSVPSRIKQLRAKLTELKPDILHARSRVPAWLTWFANRQLQIPFVTTVHGMNSVNRYSQIMSQGEHVICVSEVIKSYLLEHYPVDKKNLTVIQRGVDMQLFNPNQLDQEFIKSFLTQNELHNRFIVSSVGRITFLKDYETFIKAIAQCAKTIPEITGVIIGGVREDKTTYLESLKRLTQDLGIEKQILFVGTQSKMAELYKLSDIVVNASLKMSNVGRTVVEALAMNTPVIATTFDGLQNIVHDEVNGYVINTQDSDQLSDRILRLNKTPITDTRSTIPYEFTLEAMVKNTTDVYQNLLHSHGHFDSA